MNVALLSGAYINSGDFLIEKRCRKLIEKNVEGVMIHRFLRKEMKEQINEINQMDAIVFTGGPIYMPNIENNIPIEVVLDNIKPPMMIVGGGWYGRGNASCLPYNYKFSEFSMNFLNKIDQKGYGLACRDLYSLKILKHYGFKNVFMTGCPAWYDLDYINDSKIKEINGIRKVIISDPANSQNKGIALDLLKYTCERFDQAEIILAIHRGITSNHKDLCDFANKKGVQVIDLSCSDDGFSIYDNCDLHIGFRVHAHIYNLSIRNRTVLIEEDGRGSGVNEALGLPSIIAFNDGFQIPNRYINYISVKSGYSLNKNVIKDLDVILDLHEKTDWYYYLNAFNMMQRYYLNMKEYISQLNQ